MYKKFTIEPTLSRQLVLLIYHINWKFIMYLYFLIFGLIFYFYGEEKGDKENNRWTLSIGPTKRMILYKAVH